MDSATLRPIIAVATSFVASCVSTWIAVRLFSKWGWVARSRSDRWHKGTPCLFGGIPLFFTFIATAVVMVPPSNITIWKLIAVSTGMFALGLFDDVFNLPPRRKFLLQIVATGLVLALGVVYPFRANSAINSVVSAVWILGITNAFNLLDNMDGLSAGIALIASVYLSVIFFEANATGPFLVLMCLAGAIAGF